MKNRLSNIFLEGAGFTKVIPSEGLLKELGMTRKRFYQLMDNRGSHEMTVSEQVRLESWLSRIDNIDMGLFDEASEILETSK